MCHHFIVHNLAVRPLVLAPMDNHASFMISLEVAELTDQTLRSAVTPRKSGIGQISMDFADLVGGR